MVCPRRGNRLAAGHLALGAGCSRHRLFAALHSSSARHARLAADRAGTELPEASGLWGVILDELYRMQQKDRRERVRLRALISYLRESFTSLPTAP